MQVFGGCSAGGRGAMYNLDYIPGVLAGLGATEITTVGLMDAALWVDIEPMLPSITSQQCQTAAMAQMANATGRMGSACLAQYPGVDSWKVRLRAAEPAQAAFPQVGLATGLGPGSKLR